MFQCFCINGGGYSKHAVFMKTAVGNQNMEVRMKSEKIAEGLNDDNSPGNSFFTLT